MAEKTLVARRGRYAQILATEGDEDRLIVHTGQNVGPVMDHVKEMRDARPMKNMRPVAEIPYVLYQRLQRQGITTDPAALRKWINDPDNRAFKIAPGQV